MIDGVFPSHSHPENDGTMPLDEVQRQLGLTGNANAYDDLDGGLDIAYKVEIEQMTAEANRVLIDALTHDDQSIFDLAGINRRSAVYLSNPEPDIFRPSALTGSIAEAAGNMTPGQLLYLRQQAVQYALLKTGIELPGM